MKSPQSSTRRKKPKLPLTVRRVTGQSMLPTLLPGQVVVIWQWARIKPGDVVMVQHKGLEKIKRIQDVKDQRIYVVGDNPSQSTDSRQFGWLTINHVRGRVVGKRLDPPHLTP